MAAAHYTIEVRFHGTWFHRHCGYVVAYSFDYEPNVIRLAFGEE